MSDEEKKAIEYLKIEYEKLIKEDNILFPLYKSDAKRLIEIIEKQSKEIEELKEIKSKLDEKNIPIETLLAEFERLEDLEDDLTTVYLNGVYDGEKKVEDKIKAKIEIRKEEKANCKDSIEEKYLLREIYVLQSLLEKKE